MPAETFSRRAVSGLLERFWQGKGRGTAGERRHGELMRGIGHFWEDTQREKSGPAQYPPRAEV